MNIAERFIQVRDFAVKVVEFIKRHPRASIAAAAALLIAGPLLTGAGGGAFFLNMVGLGIVALVVRRIMLANETRQARQANRRCRCHTQQPAQQQAANQQAQGGTP